MPTQRGVLLLVGSLLAASCFPQVVQAHVGDWIYPIHEISDEDLMRIDLHDGSIEDWEEIVGEPSVLSLEFHSLRTHGTSSDPVPYDPADLTFRIWLGWNRTHQLLLLAYEGYDNWYVNTYPGGNINRMSDYDHIEFMVDGDHSGGPYAIVAADQSEEERKLNVCRTAQSVHAVAEALDNRSAGYIGTIAGWVNEAPYVDGGGMATGEESAVVVIELEMMPFDDLLWNDQEGSVASELSPGKVIGFDIDVMDNDTGPRDSHALFSLSGEFESIFFADFFVDGMLVGVGEDTAVEGVSWGRIKASFR